MFLSCWRQQHHCRREFDSCLPAVRAHARLGTLLSILHRVTNPRGCTSTRILWRCSVALRLTGVLSTPPPVCIWLLHHFSATGKAQAKWELGEAPAAAVCTEAKRRRQDQAHAGRGGKRGQSITASTESPSQTGSILGGGTYTWTEVTAGYRSLHKKYTNGVRGDRIENIRARTCPSAHTAALGHLQGWQIPLFPFDRVGSAGIREPTTAGPRLSAWPAA